MQDECCIPKAPIVMPSNNRGKVYYRAIAILFHVCYLPFQLRDKKYVYCVLLYESAWENNNYFLFVQTTKVYVMTKASSCGL